MDRRFLVGCSTLVALWFAACNVYDSALLTGSVDAGPGSGGAVSSGGIAGVTSGSSGTSPTSGGGGAVGGTSPGSGEGGDDGPSGGTMTGGATTGGSAGNGAGGPAGQSGSGGSSGATTGGASGDGGTGGASAGIGGAGNGGGGMSGDSGSGGAGGSAGGAIVQLIGTATADSEELAPAHPASDGNDGLTSTRWCAANGTAGHYWTLDLGAVHLLSRFEVMWEYPNQAAGLPYGYVVSVSNDGTTFTSSIDLSANMDTLQIQSRDFPPSTSGRHVRITVTSLPRGAWASFYEARVFGQ